MVLKNQKYDSESFIKTIIQKDMIEYTVKVINA